MELESKIEGLLFYKGEEIEVKKLAELLKVSENEIEEGLKKLETSLSKRGLVIVRNGNSIVLGISKELSPIIESIRKDEITKDLSKASLETLSIILYKDGVSRSEIDYIRGVNSSFILRNLLIRGLIEKVTDPKDNRRLLYHITFELLSYLGLTSIDQLPNYTNVRQELETIINQQENNNE